ncbi:MAG TPA: MlaD family protein [Mycobacteriales bacterium]|jgi:phospholipid/cholesterol/gamma-HCH transport system substrate-binding protein|nr:MlaD family protein [Mycobacteriales bacterium]
MNRRLIRFQFLVFLIVTAIGVTYAAITYVKIPQLLGYHRYTINVQLANSGGLYPDANVTLRGVDVGIVKKVSLTDTGVVAQLQINDSVKVPRDARAEVRNTSAIGEQYVDLIPSTSSGPYLPHGGTILQANTSTPLPINTVLKNVNALVASVPSDALTTVVDELYTGLNGNAPALQRIVDAGQLLVHDANANIGPVTTLIQDAQLVLQTQQSVAPYLESYVSNLRSVTDQLVDSDADIRGVVAQTPSFANELSAFLDQVAPVLPSVLANLTSVGKVVEVYLPSVQHLLSVLPATNNAIMGDIISSPVFDGKKYAGLNFKLSVNSQYCTDGFSEANNYRNPGDLSLASPNSQIPASSYCGANGTTPAKDKISRGARNSQCPNNPDLRSASAAGCGLIFDPNPEALGTACSIGTDNNTCGQSGFLADNGSGASSATYDPASGVSVLPGGNPIILGNVLPGGQITNWKSLFLNPLGGSAP